MTLPLHQTQLEFMRELVQNRISWLDPFFQFLAYFDSPYFFFVLIPLLWLGVSYQWGLRIFYWLTFNNLLNSGAKALLAWPRPSTDDPSLGFFHPHSYGCPSGGAQTCFFLGALLISSWRTPLAWVVGLFYILLISFSRLYLGVHYPIDILGGWILGLSLFLLFIFTHKPLERLLKQANPLIPLLIGLLVPLLIIFFFPYLTYIMGSIMGITLGTYFSLRHHLFLSPAKNLNEGLGRAFTGLCLLFLLLFLWPGGQTFFKSFAISLAMSLLASPLCRWFMNLYRS